MIGATTGSADNQSGISKHGKTFRPRIRFVSLAFVLNLEIQMMSTLNVLDSLVAMTPYDGSSIKDFSEKNKQQTTVAGVSGGSRIFRP